MKKHPEIHWLFAYILALLTLALMGGCWAQQNMEENTGQGEENRMAAESPLSGALDNQGAEQLTGQTDNREAIIITPGKLIRERPRKRPEKIQPDEQASILAASQPHAQSDSRLEEHIEQPVAQPPQPAAGLITGQANDQGVQHTPKQAEDKNNEQPDHINILEQKEKNLPLVAIIIDDMGFHQQLGKKMLDLPLNLTFSFLPHAPFTKQQEQKAYDMGRDVLLHLPMEPQDSTWDPGPSALYLSTPPEQISTIVNQYLELVPHAIGANNHMGSLFTENQEAMRSVLKILQTHNLFFVDSFTTSKSVGIQVARQLGLPSARRNIFLDNVHKKENVCNQLELLIKQAEKRGRAIGIGHPNEATLTALTKCRADLLKRVKLVSVRELVSGDQKINIADTHRKTAAVTVPH